jgi:hypothetical protein
MRKYGDVGKITSTTNQIKASAAATIRDVGNYRGAKCDTGHYLVHMTN